MRRNTIEKRWAKNSCRRKRVLHRTGIFAIFVDNNTAPKDEGFFYYYFFMNNLNFEVQFSNTNSENYYPTHNLSISDWLAEWDFKNANTGTYTHKIHQYPAMFIPQLVRKILLEYSQKGDTVLDIFSGSGSALVESLVTGRKGIGIELNPLAVLISQVKTTAIAGETLKNRYLKLLEKLYEEKKSNRNYNFKNIDFWFSLEIIQYFSHILNCIQTEENEDIRNAFSVCFSDIVRFFSRCKHSGFKLHRDKAKEKQKVQFDEVIQKFHQSFLVLYQGINELNHVGDFSRPVIIKGDSRTTVAYGQFSRLSSQWLGLLDSPDSITDIDKQLLGGMTHKIHLEDPILQQSVTLKNTFYAFHYQIQKENTSDIQKKILLRAKDVLSFYKDLDSTIRNAGKYLKRNKYFVLVTGSRTVKDIKLHTDIIIAELAENYGFSLESIFYRKSIPNKRMPHKVSPSNIAGETAPTMTKESIVILKKTTPYST